MIWFQRRRNVDQRKIFSQGEEAYPKEGETPKWIKSWGRIKGGIMALGGGQPIIGWWKASKWRGIWRLDKVFGQGTRIEAFCYHRLNRRRAKWTHRCNHREGLQARVLPRINRRYESYIRRCIGRWRPRKLLTPVEPTMHRSNASVQLSREVVFGGTWRSYNHRLNRR